VELIAIVCLAAKVIAASPSTPQSVTAPATTPPVSTATTEAQVADDDATLDVAEPDFVVINLPTAMRLPLFRSNFRLTHRFAGNLRRGSFGDQAGNLFGIDQGAIIGFEYRFAVARHAQAAFYRSSFDKTIQFHGKYDGVRQRGATPVSLSALVSIEGTNNFRDKYAPAIGAVVSRTISTRVAAYLTPIWVDNTAASLAPIVHDHEEHANADAQASSRRSTTVVGVGGRVRIGGSTYVAAEIVSRVAGYQPDEPAFGVSVEKRVGAHVFSLTVTNGFGTTFAQVARGGTAGSLYLGFNLARKFF